MHFVKIFHYEQRPSSFWGWMMQGLALIKFQNKQSFIVNMALLLPISKNLQRNIGNYLENNFWRLDVSQQMMFTMSLLVVKVTI